MLCKPSDAVQVLTVHVGKRSPLKWLLRRSLCLVQVHVIGLAVGTEDGHAWSLRGVRLGLIEGFFLFKG